MALAVCCGFTARFVSDLVGNPEDRFSHNEAHIAFFYGCFQIKEVVIFFLLLLKTFAGCERFQRVPIVYVLSKNNKTNVNPFQTQFYYIQVGFNWSKLHGHVSMMIES